MKTPLIAATIAAGALALAGCASTSGQIVDGPAELTAAPSPTETGAVPLGAAWEYDSGLTMKLGKPKTYRPGKYSTPLAKTDSALVTTVTIDNQTGAAYDPIAFYATAIAGEAGQSCEQIFDSEARVDGTPSTTISNGRRVTFDLGFACPVPSGELITIEAASDLASLDNTEVLFEGRLP
tara:strand:- start:915 stop:1454 length:540 start_codon:yes stop_codon:yes gene_type:complete